jgi:hypothetical protein
MASTPSPLARRTSSGCRMPLRMIGRLVIDRIQGRSCQSQRVSEDSSPSSTAARMSASGALASRAPKTWSLVELARQ